MTDTIHEYFPCKPGDLRSRVRDLLIEKKMSQAELAEKIGMSESSFSRYMSGQTDKLSTNSIIAIASVFGVSTDFLLCLTNIPYRTNYDIEKLGLTAEAAKSLMNRTVNPDIINILLTMPEFALLTHKLEDIQKGIMAAGVASMKAIPHQAQSMMLEFTKTDPEKRRALQETFKEIRANQPGTAYDYDVITAENIFRKIMQAFREKGKSHAEDSARLTSEKMRQIAAAFQWQTNAQGMLTDFTPEKMVEAILAESGPLPLNEEETADLRTAMLPLFKRTCKLGEQAQDKVKPHANKDDIDAIDLSL